MPPTTLSAFSKRLRILKGFIAFLLCVSFVLPQIFAPRAAKASAGPAAPKSAPPEAFLIHGPSSASVELISSLMGIANTIREVINGPAIPEGLEMAKVPSLTERLGSMMASAVTVNPAPAPAPPVPSGTVEFDFDDDGKADIGRWRGASGEFKVQNSSSGTYSTCSLGTSAVLSPADFDADGKTDMAVFSGGTWTVKRASDCQTILSISGFGQSSDIPVSGNYVGSANADAAVFRPSNSTWYIRDTDTGNITSAAFGTSGDIAVPGNYDGDTVMDLAVFRPSTGDWHVQGSTSGYYAFHWGVASDIPVPADFDGDGKTDFAVYRGSTGTFYAYKSGTPGQYFTQVWGNYGDQPVPADFDGDGKADFAIWRPTNGVWYTIKSSNSTYDYDTLGAPGEMAVPSAYLKQIGGQVFGSSLAKARLAPRNATGGTNLYSQNFSWGTSLVSLPGRAGLDAGVGLSYNSLVWTKDGDTINFDTNNDNVSPGFRFGFPTFEPVYYDSVTQKWNYLMVTPSGGRTEFRQTAASDTYETADSSYVQLKTKGAVNPNDPVEDISLDVTGTDGTKMSYEWAGGAFRCSQIKDRNGNYITVSHDEQGILRTVTDTLGRVITVNYDAQLYPTSITQTWKNNNGSGTDETHTWATFAYSTQEINTSFGNGITSVFGPPNGTVLKVLTKVTYGDTTNNTGDTRFTYNSYGQVTKIANHAADGHELNHTSTNLDSISGVQSDCPRFTLTRSWVENFNLDGNGEEQPIVLNNTAPTSSSFSLPGSLTGNAAVIDVWMTGHPDNLRTKTYFGESVWKEGLPLASEDCLTISSTCTDRKRWTWTAWTQDDEQLGYIENPRVIETRVGDGTNTKRITTEYLNYPLTSIAQYGLVSATNVYDTNQATVLKRLETDYNLAGAYTVRRILGLPSEVRSYGYENGSLPLVSKTTYLHDEGNFNDTTLNQNISPVQHDNTNYGASFIIGRGNLTSTTRHDVLGQSSAVTSTAKYNTAGVPVAQIDQMSRMVKIGYADNFNSTVSNSTYAYPTTLTDPAGNSSTVKYRYDIGANVRAESPAPQSQSKITERLFDSFGRLEKETLLNTGAYTRYSRPTPDNGRQTFVHSTVIDLSNDGVDASDEVMSETLTDGAGRVMRSRTEHPGSSTGWSGSIVEYDILGRVKRSTVPTEINPISTSNWIPAGDDNRGVDGSGNPLWLWNSQEYDWKGRITRQINTDGTDRLISYEGCGCAGGQITTVRGENIIETDWQGNNPVTLGRRTQKIYEDILGRNLQTEIYDWNGASIYATTVNTYNGRDQIVNTRQYSGSAASGIYRDVVMTYDGVGRMKTRHYPIENAGANTTWTYNNDDSINTITDPRGVVTNFSYYPTTGLLHQITYDVPSGQQTVIPDTPDVTFTYDNLGNRIGMTDGAGTTSYAYNQLSQITSETKTYNGVAGSYTMNYGYNLGAFTSISNPHDQNDVVTFIYDKTARLNKARETFQNSTTEYITDTKYRAWGAIKEYGHSNPNANPLPTLAKIKYNYDNRLMVSDYELTANTNGGSTLSLKDAMSFTRYADGNLKYAKEGSVAYQWEGRRWLDRMYKYDQIGRMWQGLSGKDANPNASVDGPYKQTFTYNAYSETSQVSGKHWGVDARPANWSPDPYTGRVGGTYDAAGNTLSFRIQDYPTVLNATAKFDAAGRQVETFTPTTDPDGYDVTTTTVYDGDGQVVKTTSTGIVTSVSIQIHSAVAKTVGNLSVQNSVNTFQVAVNGAVLSHTDSAGMYLGFTGPEGLRGYSHATQLNENDPRGGDAGMDNPYNSLTGDATTNYNSCSWEGLQMSCEMATRLTELSTRVDNLSWAQGQPSQTTPVKQANVHEALHGLSAARQTTTTTKPDDGEDPKPVEPPSVPDDEGDGCNDYGEGVDPKCHVQSLPWSGNDVDASEGIISSGMLQERACHRMAAMLGTMIDDGIRSLGGAGTIKTHQQLDIVMNAVDAQFTPFYTGWNGTIATANDGEARPSTGGGIEQLPPLGGTGGFKREYLDSKNEHEGQTHHFAAYFSAGINGAYAKSTLHKWGTDALNTGDRNLGDVAYAFGASLLNRTHVETRLNPRNPKAPTAVTVSEPVLDRLARFRNLGSQVRSKICN